LAASAARDIRNMQAIPTHSPMTGLGWRATLGITCDQVPRCGATSVTWIDAFFTSLIPHFVTDGPSAAWQSTELAGVFVLLGLACLTAFAMFAGSAGIARLALRPACVRNCLWERHLLAFGPRL
jgi:hypothetical protein